MSGAELNSPGFTAGLNYPHHLECQLVLASDTGMAIKLMFDSMDLADATQTKQSRKDYIKVTTQHPFKDLFQSVLMNICHGFHN